MCFFWNVEALDRLMSAAADAGDVDHTELALVMHICLSYVDLEHLPNTGLFNVPYL